MRVAPRRSAAMRASMTTSPWSAKPFSGVSRPCPNTSGSHATPPWGVEPRDRQRSFSEQPAVRGGIVRIEPFLRDEAVDIVKAGVVAAIDDDAAVLVDEALRAFVA